MQPFDYECMAYNADYYCVECLPDGAENEPDPAVPVFADAEVSSICACCVCGREHDYMTILDNDDGD